MVKSSSQQNGTQNETSFPWLSSSECIAWLTVLMIESVAIVIVNFLTAIVFIKTRGLRKRSIYLVINLAVADMFVGGYVGALNFFYNGVDCNFWQDNLSYFGPWPSVINAVYNTFILTSIVNLAAISLERLHATFRPFKHRLIKKWVFGGAVAFIWVTTGHNRIRIRSYFETGRLEPVTVFACVLLFLHFYLPVFYLCFLRFHCC